MKNDVDRVHGLYTVIGVRFTMDLRWQELVGVRVCGGCDAHELTVDAWGGRWTLRRPHRS
jgi:hypothetical protein